MGRYTILLATLGYLATALAAPLSLNFTIYVGALATLFTIYCGGNVSNKWVQNKPTTQVVLDRRKVDPVVESKPEDQPSEDGPGPVGG
jgi:hypothetical protein